MTMQKLTPSQKAFLEECRKGNNLLLTGKPGTGKTFILKYIIDAYLAMGKKVVIAGATGMAAANLDHGRTIHSILRWNPKQQVYDAVRCSQGIKDADLLIIDEVSMLGSGIINHLVSCLNALDHRPQLVLSGDFFQLPPVRELLYPFENPNWATFDLKPCILREVMRQSDPEYVEMLNRAMLQDRSCLDYFNRRYDGSCDEQAIFLYTRNADADRKNAEMLRSLPGELKDYPAIGNIKDAVFSNTRIQQTFYAKEGMRVMTLRNDTSGKYQNGSLGTITELKEDSIGILLDNGNEVEIRRCKYYIDNKNTQDGPAEIEQFPLRGGNAISIHKSQGQTFDSVNIEAPNCWDPGQLYVALSRARNIRGLHLMKRIEPKSLKTDPRVVAYYQRMMRENVA